MVIDSRKIELKSVSNCWICEGWSQHLFTYRPGVSDDRVEIDSFTVIRLHLDIDHYEGDTMLPDEKDPQTRILWRMLPPGKRKYFFSVDNTIQIAKDQPQGEGSAKNLQKTEYLDLSKITLPSETPEQRISTPIKGDV